MNEYDTLARNFLDSTHTTLEVKLSSNQSAPNWADDTDDKHGYKYDVTLKNECGSYTFAFWDSIAQAEKVDALAIIKNSGYGDRNSAAYFRAQDVLLKNDFRRGEISPLSITRHYNKLLDRLKPSAYSILACLDLVYDTNYEDWADNYGYDHDSRKGYKIYKACLEQDRNLRVLFTHEQLETLSEIA